jgi:hypothetical protein
MRLDGAQYAASVRLIQPTEDGTSRGELKIDARQTDKGLLVSFPRADLSTAGVYEVKLNRTDGQSESRSLAYNVLPEEGAVARVSSEQLHGRLTGVKYAFQSAADFQSVASQRAGFELSTWLLYALAALLVGEQIFAYFLGYHPPRPGVGGIR